ncbi:MAG: single-stranded DNA-binding protein [Verrucomicrobiales bacterium]|nr:single-stranded DNA-binding protein [Verrucomicrobiales bacterium]
MASLNKVMLIGNLTRDPEVRYTPKGTAVTDIGVACNRSYTTDTGERREDVTFIDVTLWGRSAELVGQYMKKGRPIYIEGRLQMDSWEDKNTGQKRSKLKVVGENFQFLGGREDGGGGGGGGQYQQPPQDQNSQQASPPPQQQQAPPPQQSGDGGASQHSGEDEDDIPF